jgi:hypothetical protein
VRAAREGVHGRGQGGQAHAAACEAAIEAGRAFEDRTPVPLLQGMDTGNAVRRYTDRPTVGLLARTVARVKVAR